METKRHLVTIAVHDVESAYTPVSDLLHKYGEHILMRVGYPMKDLGVSVIFIIIDLDLNEMGAFSGKLGQVKSVKVKTITLKLEQES